MEFEQAAVVRDKLAEISRMMEKQHAIQTKDAQQDLIAAVTTARTPWCRSPTSGGRMEGSRGFVMEDSGQEELSELTATF